MFSHRFAPQDLGPDDGRGPDAAELLEGHGSRGLHGTSALAVRIWTENFDGKKSMAKIHRNSKKSIEVGKKSPQK